MVLMAQVAATPETGNDTADSSLEGLFMDLLDEEDPKDEAGEEQEQEQEQDEDAEPESDEDPEEGEPKDEDGKKDEEQDDDLLDDEEASASKAPPEEAILQSLVPVKVDGVEQKVTVAEALAGYSRTQDYTRKTMAVAEERKEIATQRETYKTLVGQLEQYLGEVLVPANKPDAALRESDPGEYAAQMQDWNTLETQRAQARAEKERLAGEDSQKSQVALQEFREQEFAKVVAALPHWKDADVRQKEAKIIRQGALALGFSDEDLGNLHYAPAILALRKAVLYDRQKAKVKAVARPAASKGTLKPGAAKAQVDPKGKTSAKKAAQRLRSTGSVDAFADLLIASGSLDDIK
jgi:hypothetical protein